MLHKPAEPMGEDLAAPYKMRLGIWMFLLYGAVYAGFILINVIKPVLMETIIFFGLNLAVVYGFGLILFALILAFIYNRACVGKECETDAQAGRGK
ncbi:MAG: DUF485 domain-containing protein [Anaerolineae bacterium]|nr:DUF485 domain-containing protein [Anaerolineae bacterium]